MNSLVLLRLLLVVTNMVGHGWSEIRSRSLHIEDHLLRDFNLLHESQYL